MNHFFNFKSVMAMTVAAGFMVLAAGSDEQPVGPFSQPNANDALNIPNDELASDAPEVVDPKGSISNPVIEVLEQDDYKYLSMTLTGIWNEAESDWLELGGTGMPDQNVWVTIDNEPKGIDVYNNNSEESQTLLADVVFLVDNSGSMGEEAEAVANSILAWSTILSDSGLDLKVGCVGYGDSYNAVDGALNMTTSDAMANWMKNNGYGTRRTHYFGGDDASHLSTLASSRAYYNGSYNECGMVALHFAHDNFNFRQGSNRIYVNFTDEPNQPYGIEKWSVEYLNPENGNWQSNYGTVHTVFSEGEHSYDGWWSNLYNEKPWLMSEYTGGTILFTDRYFTDFTLENLPVTGAMQNSYVIRLTNIDHLFDGKEHTITITVFSADGKVQVTKSFVFVFGA